LKIEAGRRRVHFGNCLYVLPWKVAFEPLKTARENVSSTKSEESDGDLRFND